MIVELFGCPGSGKTYAIETISEKEAYKNISKSKGIKKRVKQFVKKLILLSPCAFDVRKIIKKSITTTSKSRGKYTYMNIGEFIRNISMLLGIYYYISYINRNLYIDEGIVHRVISMGINYGLTKETTGDIIESLEKYLKKVKIFYLATPIDVCYQSIVKRNRKESVIDFLSTEEVKDMLSEYFLYCEYIQRRFGYERIKRDEIQGEGK